LSDGTLIDWRCTGMSLTDYHAKYLAHELTKRCPSDSFQKLAATLADAQVDLNPHQIDAALFAFRSPLSKGAVLADEVGLGKTIEAGILLSQKCAEQKRKLLIIVPAALRKQWNQELVDKFFLSSDNHPKGPWKATPLQTEKLLAERSSEKRLRGVARLAENGGRV
jgi:SNF2 family DNA or RNA helicase